MTHHSHSYVSVISTACDRYLIEHKHIFNWVQIFDVTGNCFSDEILYSYNEVLYVKPAVVVKNLDIFIFVVFRGHRAHVHCFNLEVKLFQL